MLDRHLPAVCDVSVTNVCNACMMACYRHASMLMRAGIAAADAVRALANGNVRAAISSVFRRSVAQQLWALAEELPRVRNAR
jgi:hypothetical protein